MQYRLSTLFLIFFMVAASLALFGSIGLWIFSIILLVALILNKTKKLSMGIQSSVYIIFIGIICPGIMTYSLTFRESIRELARCAACINNLKGIGLAMHNYHDANKHFPRPNIYDKDGKPLFSWRVEILPMMEYGPLYNSLKNVEPWNSPTNAPLLSTVPLPEYICCSTSSNIYSTNYVAVIGPGTPWNEDRTMNLSEFPDGGSHTVMLVETENANMHWAEPRDLTVEEALEGLRTGKGLRILSPHPGVINVLFADGAVRSLPSRMPISLWEKLLAGEITDLENIEKMIDPSAPDMVDVSILPPKPDRWAIILSIIVWLLSVALLFRRAIKSRRKPEPIMQPS
jgi:prepilin-type processing-associated H-X9-DG protein